MCSYPSGERWSRRSSGISSPRLGEFGHRSREVRRVPQRYGSRHEGEDGDVVKRDELLKGEVGRIRNVVQAPDGSLWVTTSNRDDYGSPVTGEDDRIIRLAPAGA